MKSDPPKKKLFIVNALCILRDHKGISRNFMIPDFTIKSLMIPQLILCVRCKGVVDVHYFLRNIQLFQQH